ncbi:MAG: GTP cyclohydrolase II [Burkholderiaceae bacterium]
MNGSLAPNPNASSGHPVDEQPDAERQRLAAIRVDRACIELRRGRLLALDANNLSDAPLAAGEGGGPAPSTLLVAAVETLSEAALRSLITAGTAPQLLLSVERLHALGWSEASTPRALSLRGPFTLVQLQQLAAVTAGPGDPSLLGEADADTSATPLLHAALALCKLARLLPALVVVRVDQGAVLDADDVLRLDPADVARAAPMRAGALRRVSDAKVPLQAHEDCTLVLFREIDGDAEHVAIVVGRPVADEPVAVRLHSACLTGDLLGSLRCDCGLQLQRAVKRLAETGGVLLYLAQEGRGTGLANKLRAYRLQDVGLDTLQADRHLGFRDDERDYSPAAAMLRALGYPRIRLLTNNPHKIEALRRAGIEVVDRLPLHTPVNDHNARYMQTKQQAGHILADE